MLCGIKPSLRLPPGEVVGDYEVFRIDKLEWRIVKGFLTTLMAVAEDCLRWSRISAVGQAEACVSSGNLGMPILETRKSLARS